MYTKVNNIKPQFSNFLIGICVFLIGISSNAQCAMCRASLQGNDNMAKAEAVNDGIVYLMIIPYVLIGAIGYYIFQMYKKKQN